MILFLCITPKNELSVYAVAPQHVLKVLRVFFSGGSAAQVIKLLFTMKLEWLQFCIFSSQEKEEAQG